MARQFSDASGEIWTASESGFYFGDGDAPEDEFFTEGGIAAVEFRSERGTRVTGYMFRGAMNAATDEQLLNELRDALQQPREVQ
jgi:hypothetical protein